MTKTIEHVITILTEPLFNVPQFTRRHHQTVCPSIKFLQSITMSFFSRSNAGNNSTPPPDPNRGPSYPYTRAPPPPSRNDLLPSGYGGRNQAPPDPYAQQEKYSGSQSGGYGGSQYSGSRHSSSRHGGSQTGSR